MANDQNLSEMKSSKVWWRRCGLSILALAPLIALETAIFMYLGIGHINLSTKIPEGAFFCILFGVSFATASAIRDKKARSRDK